MSKLSLLDDCQNCLSKGHESWKLYFSKWEALAKQEENVPENKLLDEWDEDIELPIPKNKKKPNKQSFEESIYFVLSPTSEKTIKEKKDIKTLTKKKIRKKKERTQKVIEQPSGMVNENLPEDSSNEQMELNLRTVFMDILKANKNKWDIFNVLSQTFSHGELTKSSHNLILNKHLALTSNDRKLDNRGFLFRSLGFQSAAPKAPGEIWAHNSFSFQGFYQNSYRIFENHLGFFDKPSPNLDIDKLIDHRFTINGFSFHNENERDSALLPLNMTRTPHASKIEFGMRNRLLQSCPSKIFPSSHLNISEYRRNKMLKPLALDFGNKYTAGERGKINNEYLVRNGYEQAVSQRAADIFREKSFQDLCLHKRTNDVSLNMENSNFITPKRKPAERKCFSENISQRKRRRPSKLAFFDNQEESESDDDAATENRSPIIRCQSKKRKTEITTKEIMVESDSDECESILDRISHKF